MYKAHALGNLVGSLLVDQLGQQFIGEGEGGGGTLTCSDIAVDGDEVGGIGSLCLFQCLLEAWIAGSLLAFQDA